MFVVPFPFRYNWIESGGNKYCVSEFILCGFQVDDAPQFGKISDIIVINNDMAFICYHANVFYNWNGSSFS